MNYKQNFYLKNERYWCKLCGESVPTTWHYYYQNHIRDIHPELLKMIVPYFTWSPKLDEELVRLVGENIHRNMDTKKYKKGVKEIDWCHIADQMNLNNTNSCQLSPIQAKSRWDKMVNNLVKLPQKNGYVHFETQTLNEII